MLQAVYTKILQTVHGAMKWKSAALLMYFPVKLCSLT